MEKITTTTTCGDGGGGEDFLIQEILVCLPVKSLLRFKSVCKSWRQLIQSSFFINLHTTTTFINSSSSSSKFGDTFILQTTEYSTEKYEDDINLYMLSSSSESGSNGDHGDGEDNDNEEDEDDIKLYMLSSSSESGSNGDHGDGEDNDNEEDDYDQKKMVFKVDDLGFWPFYKDYELHHTLRMVGSCNGIICLHDPEVMDDDRAKQHYSNLRDVCLWNPATRHFRILPKSIPIEEGKHGVGSIQVYGTFVEDFVAFGFDVKNNDYKVFRITSFIQDWGVEGCMCHVQVYSLSTDSWRLLEGINSLPVIPSQFHFDNHGIYLNGSYFFVGTKFRYGVCDYMMLSFDFTKETFTTMQLPDNPSVLSCMGEKLAVFTRTRIDDDCDGTGYEYYDIWVLNEKNGSILVNKESWTKLRSFRIKKKPYTKPRCISNNGEFALISSGYNDGLTNKLQLINLVTKEAQKDFLIGTQICRADVYKESLVSIMGGGNVLLRWQLPTHGTTYKLNLDAPFVDSHFGFGIGLCLTSDTGGCIGVRSLKAFYVRDATQGVALAMLEAIKWAKKLELSPIIIESNSKNCVSFFMDDDDDDDNNSTYWSSEALSLLREAKLLLNSSEIGSISLNYCSRSCNYVADIAAKLGREGCWHCKEWTANSPGEIVMSLSKDLGLETENYWAFDSGLKTENYWASDSCLETENYWASDSGLKTEKGWASDSDIEMDKDWANDSGLETDKGWASE